MASTTPSSADRPIQLLWDDGQVGITPEDENRFVMALPTKIDAIQQQVALDRLRTQLRSDFFPIVHRWCHNHAERVLACYMAAPAEHYTIYIVTRSNRFDLTLSDAVADLDSQLFDANWPVEVLQIPASGDQQLRAFFNPASSLEIYHAQRG